MPPRAEVLRSAFINAGHRVSGSHTCPLALKTDAPPRVVWDILRCWIAQHPVKPPKPGSYAANILSRTPELEADFRRAAGAVPASSKAGVPRFVQNPAFWGPKARHGRPLTAEQQKQQAAQAEQRRAREAARSGSDQQAAAAAGDTSPPEQKQQQQQPQQQEPSAAEDPSQELLGLYDAEGGGPDGDSSPPAKRPCQGTSRKAG